MAEQMKCVLPYANDGRTLEGEWVSRKAKFSNPPPKFTNEEWLLHLKRMENAVEGERQTSEYCQTQAARLADETFESIQKAEEDVLFGLQERISNTQHWRDEQERKFADLNNEIDAGLIYRRRVEHAQSSLCATLQVNSEVIALRDCRCGIDLTHDVAQKELIHEMKVIDGIDMILKRTIEQITETLRLLRKAKFNLNRGLVEKDIAVDIDKKAYGLNIHREDVLRSCCVCVFDESNVDEAGYEDETRKRMLNAEKEINASLQLRSYTDSILRQICEDLKAQVCKTNVALEKRIREIVQAKDKLQNQHSGTTVKVREIQETICLLNQSFEEKFGNVALAETRFELRKKRPGLENVNDAVQRRLALELQELHEAQARLNKKILESRIILRNLQRNQIELEEAINVKMQAISIDDAQVMPLRRQIDVQEY